MFFFVYVNEEDTQIMHIFRFCVAARFRFVNRVGFPLMIGSIITATFYLMVSHVLFEWH